MCKFDTTEDVPTWSESPLLLLNKATDFHCQTMVVPTAKLLRFIFVIRFI